MEEVSIARKTFLTLLSLALWLSSIPLSAHSSMKLFDTVSFSSSPVAPSQSESERGEDISGDMVKAIEEGDLVKLKALLKRGAKVNGETETPYGVVTPIFHAIRKQDVSICRHLIESGARLDVTFKAFGTPLHYAVFKDSKELVALLLDSQADPNRRIAIEHPLFGPELHRLEVSPLHLTVMVFGNKAILQLLAERGADLRLKTGGFSQDCPEGCTLEDLARLAKRPGLIPFLHSLRVPKGK